MNNVFNRKVDLQFIMSEGHEDYQEIKSVRAAIAAAQHDQEGRINPVIFRRAKQQAARLGLTYWPALINDGYQPKIDPLAYVYAEEVLERKHGLWDGKTNSGGWDRYGHYGLSRGTVARMWYASGCRDTGKFKLQVAMGEVARRGDTATWFKNYVRGDRWYMSNIAAFEDLGTISRKAIAFLGRLSPALRWAALWGVASNEARGGKPLRIRDLNLDLVAKAQVNPRAGYHALPVGTLVRMALGGEQILGTRLQEIAAAAFLTPAYPNLPLFIARRIASGESPLAIYRVVVPTCTKKDAHQWALWGKTPVEVHDDLIIRAEHHIRGEHGVGVVLRTIKVANWLLAVFADPLRKEAILATRVRYVGGEEVEFNLIPAIDEVQDEDILSDADGVNAVFNRVSQRNSEEYAKMMKDNTTVLAPTPDWMESRPSWVRVLDTPAMLIKEGSEMIHCVGTYVEAVRKLCCVILAIETAHGRSTVEVTPQGRLLQHRSVKNAEPPARHEQWLRAWLKRHAPMFIDKAA